MPDPFDTLGVEPRFNLDLEVLHQRLLALSAEHHPDRFTDPLDQADAVDRVSDINAAFRVLSDPAARAEALLVRRGGVAAGDEKALPPDLLMEVMEVREELEDAVAADDQPTLSRLRSWAETQRDTRLNRIADLFAKEPVDPSAVKLQLNALRYAARMLEQMPPATQP